MWNAQSHQIWQKSRPVAFNLASDTSPSEADMRLTRRIIEASRILQLNLIDHVIIGTPAPGRSGYFSFKEGGVIA
jgi:DNA repair protein RadC